MKQFSATISHGQVRVQTEKENQNISNICFDLRTSLRKIRIDDTCVQNFCIDRS